MGRESNARIGELVQGLGLRHLNAEAGLFSVIGVSQLEVDASDGRSPVSNAIYFMLTKEEPHNYIHWLYSDDYQTLIEGGPADYYLFYPDGSVRNYTMGRDTGQGQTLVVPCPAGARKAIVLGERADYLLVSSVVTPAWSPRRARIGVDDTFITQYAGKAAWATPDFLRKLAGPGYGHILGASDEDFSVGVDDDGQILWQGMQLTEEQVEFELESLARDHQEAEFCIAVDGKSDREVVNRLRSLAEDKGVRVRVEEGEAQ